MHNNETFLAALLFMFHVASFGISAFSGWNLFAVLWLVRIEAIAILALSALTLIKDWNLGYAPEVFPLTSLVLGLLSLTLGWLPLPQMVIWMLFAIHSLLAAALLLFVLTFKMRLF